MNTKGRKIDFVGNQHKYIPDCPQFKNFPHRSSNETSKRINFHYLIKVADEVTMLSSATLKVKNSDWISAISKFLIDQFKYPEQTFNLTNFNLLFLIFQSYFLALWFIRKNGKRQEVMLILIFKTFKKITYIRKHSECC